MLVFAGLTVYSASAAPVTVGESAPNFAIQLPDGLSGHLSDLKGSVVVLDFWASWCPWCVKELPDANRIDQNYDKVIVIGINDEDQATIDKASATMKLGFDTLHDANDSISALYGVDSLPSAVVIDASGNVSAVIEGYHSDGTLEKAVKAALTE